MKYAKIGGYLIKSDSITGLSDIKKVTKKDNENEQTLYVISLFFDGNMIDWFFETEAEAIALSAEIKDKLLES